MMKPSIAVRVRVARKCHQSEQYPTVQKPPNCVLSSATDQDF